MYRTHTHKHTHARTHARTHICTHTHALAYTHAHTQSHTRRHERTHTHTRARLYTPQPESVRLFADTYVILLLPALTRCVLQMWLDALDLHLYGLGLWAGILPSLGSHLTNRKIVVNAWVTAKTVMLTHTTAVQYAATGRRFQLPGVYLKWSTDQGDWLIWIVSLLFFDAVFPLDSCERIIV